jgi:hypothetical protein
MDTPNIGPYASVVGMEQTAKRIAYKRGYGNIVATTLQANKVSTVATPFNRLQPLCGEFGTHVPITADKDFIMANPQTTIAWDQTQKPGTCEYQNYSLNRMPMTNSTMPQLELTMAMNH